MQNPPYFPSQNQAQADWATNFSTLITAAPATYGLVAGDAVLIDAAVDAYVAALATATNPATRTPVAIAAKDAALANMKSVLFPYAVQIAGDSAVTNGNKTAVGVTVRITTKTRNPVTTNETANEITYTVAGAPIVKVTDPATPATKKRPLGSLGWEYQIQSRVNDPNPWTLYTTGFSSRPQITLDPADFITENEHRIRTRWNGALLPGEAPNHGPWSAWLEFSF